MKTGIRLAVSVAATVLFLALFLRGVDLSAVGRGIASAKPAPIVLGILLGWAGLWLRALRWKQLLRPVGEVPLSSSYHATTIGFAASVVLPLKAGEIVRPLLLARERKLPMAAVLATVVVDRVLDLAMILGLFLISATTARGITDPAKAAGLRSAALVGGAGLAALLAGLVVLSLRGDAAIRLAERLLAPVPPKLRAGFLGFSRHCLDGLGALRTPGGAALIAAESVVLWLLIDAQAYLDLVAVGIRLPPEASFTIVGISAAGLAAATPGGVGGFHFATQLALSLYGVPADLAATCAVVHHAACFLPLLVYGPISLLLAGASWKSVRALAAEKDAPAAASRAAP